MRTPTGFMADGFSVMAHELGREPAAELARSVALWAFRAALIAAAAFAVWMFIENYISICYWLSTPLVRLMP